MSVKRNVTVPLGTSLGSIAAAASPGILRQNRLLEAS